ncbi:Primosomal protein N' [Tepidimonas alkaliphilus]|uniref:Replication restart protein PriA n=2 Tax=Tepidimonas alkaliphilus TaxID=2588942 RepID=A0A554W4B7_9BURK|nr:Primosomal protein N' [Tepidimonas alkaliphilus]
MPEAPSALPPEPPAAGDGVALTVVVPMPAHGGLDARLSYRHPHALPAGTLVRVPLGRRTVLGVVWPEAPDGAAPAREALRPVQEVLSALPPLPDEWCALVAFAARYYQRSVGEVALAALPPALRALDAAGLQRRLARLPGAGVAAPAAPAPPLTPDQQAAVQAIAAADRPVLLFGATGSGKTEVYLQAAAQVLQRDAQAQVLMLVPEINLTPQLEARVRARFGAAVVTLHSGLTPAQRLRHWLAAHLGQARVVLGTRTAVWASLPRLRLIVVDEEHDPSYKSQEGARHSARDLAVVRAHRLAAHGCRVVLGSATPSLESWHAAQQGRYRLVELPDRIGGAARPVLRLLDLRQQPRGALLAPALLEAIQARVARGEQALLLLNRRGYAPVLACADCGWTSGCPHCSAHLVFHKAERALRCHHCGHAAPVPRACPECGNVDLVPLGRGTQRLEEHLEQALADLRRPDGTPVRIGRLDADTARTPQALQQRLAEVHRGDVDVLVGTQMVAKGHDFRRITLVAAVNPDGALFASDWRAPERLFALLLQAGGRAGRDAAFMAAQGSRAELWVQTAYPQHPLFAALARHDYPGFAAQQLEERRAAGMPPFAHQALLRAEARTLEAALAWLRLAAAQADGLPGRAHVTLYAPVPMTMVRLAGVERAQLLLESARRPALQALLAAWTPRLHALRGASAARGLLRWAIDVDPLGY